MEEILISKEIYQSPLLAFCRRLPDINNRNFENERAGMPLDISPFIEFNDTFKFENIDLLQYHLGLTLVMASAERYENGIVEKRMRRTFNEVKRIPALPPCLLTHTYYLNNPYRLTFTGDPGEVAFIDISEKITEQLRQANNLLITFEKGQTDKLIKSKNHLANIRQLFLSFYQKLDSEFFARQLRGYSQEMTVDGITYPSKSIATNAEDIKLNLLLGWPEEEYLAHIDKRWLGLSGQDTNGIHEVLQRLSDHDSVRHKVGKEDMDAFIELSKQNGKNASTHRSLIVNYVDRPHQKAQAKGDPITVQQGRYGAIGLGGLFLPEVENFRKARFENDTFINKIVNKK